MRKLLNEALDTRISLLICSKIILFTFMVSCDHYALYVQIHTFLYSLCSDMVTTQSSLRTGEIRTQNEAIMA